MTAKDTDWAFDQYQNVRATLPSARFEGPTTLVSSLADLADQFDVFLLDAFGVLNVGETAIPSAPERVADLQAAGKRVMVMTNGATVPAEAALEKYHCLGFRFDLKDVISSRDVLVAALGAYPVANWGVMAAAHSQIDRLPVSARLLGTDRRTYDAVDGFLFLSTAEWSADRQEILRVSLAENPRPVLVGNPDIVAPRESGLSMEPGYYAHNLARQTGTTPVFFGKPFGDIYNLAFQQFSNQSKERILMVGDTLHTDILGGAAAGIRTALVTGHGVFAGREIRPYIESSGIRPDFILPSP
ncbi:MAG: HAD-IIA family hydrolase [Proteobacteria bacterium]|nr:HAD-IIA family hydrolase [Pseudomonadota bacterium]